MQLSPLARIHRLKATLLALLALGLGIALLAVAKFASVEKELAWLRFWPVGEIGAILFGAGALGIAWDFVDARDKEAREDERLRRLLRESAPEMRDAVIAGFVETPDKMRGVATSETLDRLATNALALRLGDERFAREIYAGLLHQAIRTPERWEDVGIDIRLAEIRQTGEATSGATAVPLFEVTITWDYTVVPSSRIQTFAAVGNREEFHELLSETPTTSTWFVSPRAGLAASDRAAYELLQYSVDGEVRPIRRATTRTRQTYTVDLGESVVTDGKPVHIRHSMRAVVTQEGHWLQVAITQPTKDLSLRLDYTDTNIARLQVTDLVSSAKQPWISYLPQQQPTRAVSLEVPGWLLPQEEVTFIWTLDAEASAPTPTPTDAPASSA